MNHTDFQTHFLNRKEKIFGTCWLIFQTLFFATFLQVLNLLLPTPLPQTEVNLVFFVVNFTAVALIFRRYLWAQIRLVPEVFDKVLCFAITGFAAYMVMNFLLMQVLFALNPDFTSVNDVTIQKLAAEDYAIMFFGTVLLAPITEETLFRGLAFRGVYDHSPVLAWILSVTLFALVHILGYIGFYPFEMLLLCFVQYLPAGICLAAAYRLSGSLLSPILIHALVNLLAMLSLR
jgi:membrane protease YdiL (CAAX protease family)